MTVRVVQTPKYNITIQNNGKSVDVDSGKKVTVNLSGITATASGAFAPSNATYVTLGTHANLTSERVLTGTASQVTITDNGAGNTVVLSLPQNIATNSSVQFSQVDATTAVLETCRVATSFVPFVGGATLTAIVTGTASNDAMVTKGYVDDAAKINIGEEVAGGSSNAVLFIDSSGNLAVDSAFTYDNPTNTLAVDYIQINTAAAEPSHATGLIHWNTDDSTMEIGMEGTVNLQVGQEVLLRAQAIGSAVNNGQVAYVSGASGNRAQVSLAKADALATSRTSIAIATEDIAENNTGFLTSYGLVRDVNTLGFTEGAAIYLDASTAGGFTETVPTDPNYSVRVGYVVRAHATEGIIFADITQGNPVFNRIIGMTAKAIPFASNSTFMSEDPSNFVWDVTNTRLGIGTDSPAKRLHVTDTTVANTYTQIDPQADGDSYLLMSRGVAGNKLAIALRTAGVSQWYTGIADQDTADQDGDEFFIGQDAGGATPAICIDPANQYVGINEPAPTRNLHITDDTTDTYIQIENETSGKDVGIILRGVNYNYTIFNDDSQGRLRFLSGGDLNINFRSASGYMGINTTAPTSFFDNIGSVSLNITTITSDTTLTDDHFTVLIDATSNDVTASLPAASGCTRRIYKIKRIDNSAYTADVDGDGTETIDGELTRELLQYECITVQSDGSTWHII